MTTITLNAGATEADIQAALARLPSGGTLILPANQTILISNGLKIDAAARSITLDLNGSILQQAGDASVISVTGSMSALTSATIGRDGAGQLTVSSAGLGQVKAGDYVKLVSDDALPNDHGDTTRLGQAMKVVAVNGSSVTLEGELVNGDLYQTNVRVSQFKSGTIEISNGTVRGDQTHATWTDALINIRSTIATHIDKVTVRDGNSMGINFVNTVDGLVTQSAAINLTDDTANGHYGYGVHSSAAVNTTINGLYAEKVRHAVDDNAVGVTAAHRDASKYGADIGLTATNVVANANTAFAFSWHSEGRQGYFGDSVVFNSHGVVGARGTDHLVQNISGSGNERGIQFLEYGNGDGQRIVIDNMNLKETAKYAYYNTNDPKNNVISNSSFEVKATYYRMGNDPTVSLINNVLKVGALPADETINGTAKDDRLLGGTGVDTIFGGAGRDYVWGGVGADRLTGGAGADRFAYLALDEAGDIITDFEAGDVIDLSALAYRFGWSGDVLAKGCVRFAQSGSDTFVQVDTNGGTNSFVTLATLSNVRAAALSSASVSTKIMVTDYAAADALELSGLEGAGVRASALVDPFAGFVDHKKLGGTANKDKLTGGSSADLILGGAGDDKLYGLEGDDVLVGGAGADYLNGGSGDDTVSYADAAASVVASLSDASLNTGDAKGDSYSQIRNLTGGHFSDELHGSDAMNTIEGGAGNDRLFGLGGSDTLLGGAGDDVLDGGAKNDRLDGGDGNDWLFGGDGYDTLTGGAGSDTFVFNAGLRGSLATIADFTRNIDKIGLDDTGVSSLSDLQFVDRSSALKTDAAAIVYDKASGAVYWDADGNGSAGAVMLGKVTADLDLSLSDFILI